MNEKAGSQRDGPQTIVFSENAVDFKYEKITEELSVDYRSIDLVRFIVDLMCLRLRRSVWPGRAFFHVRYLKWRGYFLTIPVYLLLIAGCRLNGLRITWSCHNIWEHKFRSRIQNRILRYLISWSADSIIVFHRSVAEFLPTFARKKVVAASFGDCRGVIRRQSGRNEAFRSLLSEWKADACIEHLDLLLISSSLEDVEGTLALIRRCKRYSALAVIPKHDGIEVTDNYLIYDGYVFSALHQLLEGEERLTGLVPHKNISVPTSLYSFASYGRPIIVRNVPPLLDIVREWEIGIPFDLEDDLDGRLDRIRSSYQRFSRNCEAFVRENSWRKAADVHGEVWGRQA